MAAPRPGFTCSCHITAFAYGTRSPQGYSSAMMSSPSTLVCQRLGDRNPGSSETGAHGRGEELIMAEHEPSIGLSSGLSPVDVIRHALLRDAKAGQLRPLGAASDLITERS